MFVGASTLLSFRECSAESNESRSATCIAWGAESTKPYRNKLLPIDTHLRKKGIVVGDPWLDTVLTRWALGSDTRLRKR